MTSSNAVVIYDVSTKQPLQVVICDFDSQITASDGPVQTQLTDGLSYVLVPIGDYSAGMTFEDLVAIINAAVIT